MKKWEKITKKNTRATVSLSQTYEIAIALKLYALRATYEPTIMARHSKSERKEAKSEKVAEKNQTKMENSVFSLRLGEIRNLNSY